MDTILKAINIEDDFRHSDRVSHYFPTSRSVQVVSSVIQSGATMVIASYGSGKSLAAALGAIYISNNIKDREFLKDMSCKLEEIAPKVANAINNRVKSKKTGKVVVLSGFVRDLSAEICASLELKNQKSLKNTIDLLSELKKTDHITIIWDEFGRHLSALVREGRVHELDDVQRLAEWSARAKNPKASFTLLLHQNLLAYAENLNRTSKSEWRKIEGRFEQVHFVEDSFEIYDLLATIISERSSETPDLKKSKFIVDGAISQGWFDNCSSVEKIGELISKSYPISAGALNILPRIASRVGQHERSLFTFVENADFSNPVGMNEVYEAFSDSIRTDVGVGGLHRKWVEAESARAKCDKDVELEIIAATFLLKIGQSSERRHLTRSALELAVRSAGFRQKLVDSTITDLIKRKLILHRKVNDDISVWHGADVDVASAVAEERMKYASAFDLHDFLDTYHPAPFVRPIRHNQVKGTSRYLSGRFVQASELEKIFQLETENAPWGMVSYVICDSMEDIKSAERTAKNANKCGDGFLVIPIEPVQINEVALEIMALNRLKENESFTSEDPLIESEINELLDVAHRYLNSAINRLTSQRPASSKWYRKGKLCEVSWCRPASIVVSEFMDEKFPNTPKIINDQMVRQVLSRPMQTNRIRLITRIMEHAETKALGYGEDDGSAEATIYRTLLKNTGLHATDGKGKGYFTLPEKISDKGLKQAWKEIEKFFTVSKGKKVSLDKLVKKLSDKPIGMASGVIPILVMAGYKAFGKCVSIYSEDEYVLDVLGFASTRMFENPENHLFQVHEWDKKTKSYLENLSSIFAQRLPGEYEERIRFAIDSLNSWLSTVAEGARRSNSLSKNSKALIRLINESEDPAELLLTEIPKYLNNSKIDINLERKVKDCRIQIDGLIEGFMQDAVEVINSVLKLEDGKKSQDYFKQWISCFDVDSLLARSDLRLTDKAVLRTAEESLNGKHTNETLARVLSSILLQRGIEKWQNNSADQLRKELRECKQRIEDAALDDEIPKGEIEPLIVARINQLQKKLKLIRKSKGA